LVKNWNGEGSTNLTDIPKIDFTIVSILHDVINHESIINVETDVYDLTGKIEEAITF
jgi:hypothetical protein